MIRVALICNADGESYSMTHYAESLKDHLLSDEIHIQEIKPTYKGKSRFQKVITKYLLFPFFIRKKVKDYDLIHVVDHSYGYLLRYFSRLQRKKTLITCHDIIPLIDKDNLVNRAKFAHLSFRLWKYSVQSIKLAAYILADSESTKRDCVTSLQLDPGKIFVIPLLLKKEFRNIPESKQALRRRLALPEHLFYMVIIGSNLKRKNVLSALKTLDRLKKINDNIRLIRIGEDFDQGQKEFIANNSLDDFILFKGRLDNQSLLEYFKASDVLLFNSLYEGYGLPILEAYVLEVPVLTSNVSSMPEVAGEGAMLVDPESIDEACEGLISIMKNEDVRINLIGKGKERLKQIEKEHDKLVGIYHKIRNEN